MKNKFQHSISFILAALILSGTAAGMVSCSTDNENAESTSAQTEQTEASTEPLGESAVAVLRKNTKDTLPEDLDLGGAVMRVVSRVGSQGVRMEFTAESSTGDIIEDAVYRRNMAVEERLNTKLQIIPVEAPQGDGGQINSLISRSVSGGLDEYDIVSNHMSQITPQLVRGLYYDLHTLPYLDFEKPWWNQSYNDCATIFDKQFACAGELGMTMLSGMYVVFYNQKLYDSMYSENLYDVVTDGKWTLDAMAEFCKGMYRDLNGNAAADDADQFGLALSVSAMGPDSFVSGADLTFTEYDDANDTYVWALENERTAAFLEKITHLVHENNNTCNVDNSNKFLNDTALFHSGMLEVAFELRDMESDFGVLPMPKVDETQDGYTTWAHNGFSVFAIPTTCGQAEYAAAFMEAMCAETYRSVTADYFDVAMKVKYTRDERAAEVLDMISQNIIFDFGYVFNESISSYATDIFRTMLFDKSKCQAGMSTIAAAETAANNKLQNIINKYAALE